MFAELTFIGQENNFKTAIKNIQTDGVVDVRLQ